MREYYDYTDASRQEWLQARRNGIGASETAAILYANQWATPYQVWLDKTGKVPLDDGVDSWRMKLGRTLEDLIVNETAEHYGWRVEKPRVIYQHDECDRCLYTPDGMAYDGDVLIPIEAKTSSVASMWDDGPPLSYQFQAMQALAVTGAERCIIAAVLFTNGAQEPKYYEVQRDPEVIRAILEAIDLFWSRYVETDTPPPLAAADAPLALQYTEQIADKMQVLDADREYDVCALVDDYEQASEEEKAAKKRKDSAKATLLGLMGDAEYGVTPKHVIKLSKWDADRFDQTAFKADEPELYEKYKKPVSSHRMTIKQIDALKGKELARVREVLQIGGVE